MTQNSDSDHTQIVLREGSSSRIALSLVDFAGKPTTRGKEQVKQIIITLSSPDTHSNHHDTKHSHRDHIFIVITHIIILPKPTVCLTFAAGQLWSDLFHSSGRTTAAFVCEEQSGLRIHSLKMFHSDNVFITRKHWESTMNEAGGIETNIPIAVSRVQQCSSLFLWDMPCLLRWLTLFLYSKWGILISWGHNRETPMFDAACNARTLLWSFWHHSPDYSLMGIVFFILRPVFFALQVLWCKYVLCTRDRNDEGTSSVYFAYEKESLLDHDSMIIKFMFIDSFLIESHELTRWSLTVHSLLLLF